MFKIKKVNINNNLSLREQLSKENEIKPNPLFSNETENIQFNENDEILFLENQGSEKNDDDEIAKIRQMKGELQEDGSYKVIYKTGQNINDEEISYYFYDDGTYYVQKRRFIDSIGWVTESFKKYRKDNTLIIDEKNNYYNRDGQIVNESVIDRFLYTNVGFFSITEEEYNEISNYYEKHSKITDEYTKKKFVKTYKIIERIFGNKIDKELKFELSYKYLFFLDNSVIDSRFEIGKIEKTIENGEEKQYAVSYDKTNKYEIIGKDEKGNIIPFSYQSVKDDGLNKYKRIIEEYYINDLYNKIDNSSEIDDNIKKIIKNEKFAIYYKAVDEYYNHLIDFEKKIELAQKLLIEDSKNDNKIQYSTPILKNGTVNVNCHDEYFKYEGDYLSYYNNYGVPVTVPLASFDKDANGNIITSEIDNLDSYIVRTNHYYQDIMSTSENNYSEHFKNQVYNNLDGISLVSFSFPKDWAAFCTYIGDTNSYVTIDMNEVAKDPAFMESSYTHELGHAFARASSKNIDIDESKEWKNIYDQINKNDPNHNFLRDYAHTEPSECFAECVAEYYEDLNNSSIYNPNDLKTIDIEVGGKEMTLYDYMDELLN